MAKLRSSDNGQSVSSNLEPLSLVVIQGRTRTSELYEIKYVLRNALKIYVLFREPKAFEYHVNSLNAYVLLTGILNEILSDMCMHLHVFEASAFFLIMLLPIFTEGTWYWIELACSRKI